MFEIVVVVVSDVLECFAVVADQVAEDIVEAAAVRDIQEASVYESKLTFKMSTSYVAYI